jgi:hypothetical protein
MSKIYYEIQYENKDSESVHSVGSRFSEDDEEDTHQFLHDMLDEWLNNAHLQDTSCDKHILMRSHFVVALNCKD